MVLNDLYSRLDENNITTFEQYIPDAKALTIEIRNRYAVFLDRYKIGSETDELCILAHEIGHIETGATHRLYSPYELIEQHEYKANAWAIRQLMPKAEVMYAAACGIRECWDLAEYFSVTEEFAAAAYAYYMRDEYFFQFVMHLKTEDEIL